MSSTILTPTLPWWTVAGQTVSKAATGYLGAFFIIITLQGDSSSAHVKEATNNGNNERHGDGGRTLNKEKKRIGELETELNEAKSKKEKDVIKRKIKNIRENGDRKNRGEEHSRGNKR